MAETLCALSCSQLLSSFMALYNYISILFFTLLDEVGTRFHLFAKVDGHGTCILYSSTQYFEFDYYTAR